MMTYYIVYFFFNGEDPEEVNRFDSLDEAIEYVENSPYSNEYEGFIEECRPVFHIG